MSETVIIDLKPMPDGYGFLYGRAYRGAQAFNINVMPPVAHWSGDVKLEGCEPQPSDWILYIDGNEVGRVEARDDVEAAFVRIIAEGGWYT